MMSGFAMRQAEATFRRALAAYGAVLRAGLARAAGRERRADRRRAEDRLRVRRAL